MVENNNHMILNGVDNTQITEDMQSESKTESEDSSSNIINDQKTRKRRKSSPAISVGSVHSVTKKKDKKLVFLSRSVLHCVRECPMTTGTEIAY